jgi:small subunit ribosomal protein S18
MFCKDHSTHIDYKDVQILRKFMSDRGKIRARRVSGNCQQHQRDVALAIKTARELALLPYTQRTTSERPGGRGPGRGPREGGYSRPKADDADAEAAIENIDLDIAKVDTAEVDEIEVVGAGGPE